MKPMLKLNNLVSLLSFLPIVVICPLGLLSLNIPLLAKAPQLATLSTSTPSVIPASPNPTIADWGAIGSLLSGIVAVIALFKTNNNENQTIKLKLLVEETVNEVFNELIEKAEAESEKQRLLKKKQLFQEQFRVLSIRADASIKAQNWLKTHREKSLVDDAVKSALKNEDVRDDVRKDFRKHINQCLYVVQECLNPVIGRFDLIDKILQQLRNEQQLPRECYENALRFVIENEASKKLADDAISEMKIYFTYLIDNLP
jgi:hypothetical protein